MRFSWMVLGIGLTMAIAAPSWAESSSNCPRQRKDEVFLATTTDLARQLVCDADEVYAKAGCNAAYPRFALAYQATPIYQIAASLGTCELELSKYPDAATHLSQFLRECPAGAAEADREHVQGSLKQAMAHVLTLSLSGMEAGTAVFLDGKLLGYAPLVNEVFVEPGSHRVTATLGSKVGQAEISGKAGERLAVKVEMTPVSSQALRGQSDGDSAIRRRYAIAGSTIALGGGVAGLLSLVLGASYAQKGAQSMSTIPAQNPCGEETIYSESCAAAHRDGGRGNSLNIAGVAFLGLGAAGATMALGALLWPTRASSGATKWDVTAIVAPGQATFAFATTF